MSGAAPTAAATSPLRARDLLAALVVVILWGANFVAMKWGLRSFSPFQLGAARYLCAALPLVLLVRPPRMHWRWVLLFGLFQGVGQFGFLFMGLKVGMTAGLASVLLQTQVFFTALLGFALLRERPGLPLRVGMGLAALGLVCFAMNYVGPGSGMGVAAATTLAGLLLTLCGAAMWASSNIVARLAQQLPGWRLPDAPRQWALEVTGPVVATSSAFRFVAPYTGLEVFEKAGTVIGDNDGVPVVTPYDDCVLVMPSVRQARAGVTVVRFARRRLL